MRGSSAGRSGAQQDLGRHDAFDEATGAIDAIARFGMHLLPAGVVLGILLVAWRWETLGGVLLFGLAIGHGILARGRVSWMLVVSLPLVVEGALFLWSSLCGARRQPSS